MRLQLKAWPALLALILSAPGVAQETHEPTLTAHRPLGARLSTKLRYYTDDDGLVVVTPLAKLSQRVDDDTTLSLTYDADVISAATIDVRTAATAGFSETRHGITAAGSHRFAEQGLDLDGSISVSRERDYSSLTLSVGAAQDLLQRNLTLGGGYSFVGNIVGRSGTPFSRFNETLQIHALDGSLTQLLSRTTFVQLSTSLIAALGYQASVYRYVPVFLRETAGGMELDEQSLASGNPRPLRRPAEVVPRERYRLALVGRLKHFFTGPRMAIDGRYRFYVDSWDVVSHTLAVKLFVELGERFEVRLRSRLYYQDAASFYRPAYVVRSAAEPVELMTMDRELATFWYELAGIKLVWRPGRWAFLDEVRVDAKLDVQYTTYIDFPYLPTRLAFIPQVGLGFGL